jgi:hypothetical protein
MNSAYFAFAAPGLIPGANLIRHEPMRPLDVIAMAAIFSGVSPMGWMRSH